VKCKLCAVLEKRKTFTRHKNNWIKKFNCCMQELLLKTLELELSSTCNFGYFAEGQRDV